eukprot:6807363-Prymnesium_polylepis.1
MEILRRVSDLACSFLGATPSLGIVCRSAKFNFPHMKTSKLGSVGFRPPVTCPGIRGWYVVCSCMPDRARTVLCSDSCPSVIIIPVHADRCPGRGPR